MPTRLIIATSTCILSWLLVAPAHAQREFSKEEEARLTKLLEPWGLWGPVRTTPRTDTDALLLNVRKDPNPTASRIPADVSNRMTSAVFHEKLADADVDSFFATFPKINSIMVAKTAWTPRIGIKAGELNGVKELWAQECDLAPDDLKSIGNMTSLEVLMLSGNTRIGPALDRLSSLTQLRQLSLSGIPIPEFKKIHWLAHNTKLTSLRLTGTGIGDEANPTLKALPKLVHLLLDDMASD